MRRLPRCRNSSNTKNKGTSFPIKPSLPNCTVGRRGSDNFKVPSCSLCPTVYCNMSSRNEAQWANFKISTTEVCGSGATWTASPPTKTSPMMLKNITDASKIPEGAMAAILTRRLCGEILSNN